jgi:acyl-CoA thioester hydrolase
VSAALFELSGRIEAATHIFPIRVYYEDTDAGGRVYHANYLKYAERGRTEMLRLLNVNHTETAERYGLAFAVRNCAVDYRRAARLDDVLEVRSRLFDLRGATIGVDQGIWREAEEVAHLRLRIVCLNRKGRPARLPASIRTTLQPYAKMRE